MHVLLGNLGPFLASFVFDISSIAKVLDPSEDIRAFRRGLLVLSLIVLPHRCYGLILNVQDYTLDFAFNCKGGNIHTFVFTYGKEMCLPLSKQSICEQILQLNHEVYKSSSCKIMSNYKAKQNLDCH